MKQSHCLLFYCLIFLILTWPSVSKYGAKLNNYLPLANIPSDQVRSLLDGYFEFIAGVPTKLILYGKGFTNTTNVSLTTSNTCDAQFSNSLGHMMLGDSNETALIELHASDTLEPGIYHFCLSGEHQGKESDKSLKIVRSHKSSSLDIKKFSVHLVFLFIFLALTFIYAGEGIIIMDLTIDYLEEKQHIGTEVERKYAKGILPLRRHGKRLQAALILGGVVSSAGVSRMVEVLLLLFEPFWNLLISLALVIFIVIVPTIIFSRYPLIMCYKTRHLAYITLWVTFSGSWTYGKCLENDIDGVPEGPPVAATGDPPVAATEDSLTHPVQETEDDHEPQENTASGSVDQELNLPSGSTEVSGLQYHTIAY